MNVDYLEKAREKIPNVSLLVNIVRRRVRQLNRGERPLVKPDGPQMDNFDLALKEIAEGKLSAEMSFAPEEETPVKDRVITL